MNKEDGNFVTALSRGISILEAFDEAHPELGITQIAQKVGLSKTTTFRLVHTLVALRYLVLLSDNNKYRLGPRVLSLGYTVLKTMDLKTIAAPHLQALSDQCRSCPLINLCMWCPAHAFLETGKLDQPVDHFCRTAHARSKMLGSNL